MSRATHAAGAIFHTDAVQAVGHIPIDVKKMGIDMLSASAHKFGGPRGAGFLYIRKGIEIAPLMDGGSQERGMRAGTENTAGIVGMAVALAKSCREMDGVAEHLRRLEGIVLEGLQGTGCRRNGEGPFLPGVMSLSFPGMSGESMLHRLDLKGICVSTGSACDSVNTQVSHVLRAVRLDGARAKGTIRVSLGKENTEEEAQAIANAIKNICRV